jgi:acyl-CoA thioester hydrolase
MWIEEVRGASFVVRYEVRDGSAVAARAATKCVTFDFRIDRPRRLTDDERALLRGFADDGSAAS